MSRKHNQISVPNGCFKRSTFKQDQLSEALIEYIHKVYTEVYGLPPVSQSVIVRRALSTLAVWLPACLEEGLKEKEKQNIRAFGKNRLSPFGTEGIPQDITDKTGKLKPFIKLGREAVAVRNALLDELKIEAK